MTVKVLENLTAFKRIVNNPTKTRFFVVALVPNWSKLSEDCLENYSIISKLFKDKVNFYQLEVGLCDELTKTYCVRDVPTLLIFNTENTVVASSFGKYTLDYLQDFIFQSV